MMTFFNKAIFAFSCVTGALGAQELVLDDDSNEQLVMEITPEDSFLGILNTIQLYLDQGDGEVNDLNLILTKSDTIIVSKSKHPKKVQRQYHKGLSSSERADIGFILRTLANHNLIVIGTTYKSQLKKAGIRVEHVHPIRFLECIFGDQELKVCARNIQGKSWVWSEFLGGIVNSLKEETKNGNVKPEFIHDFAAIIGIDVNIIFPAYQQQRWEDMVLSLINMVPKGEGGDRYNW